MPKFSVSLGMYVSQTIQVEAADPEAAIEAALAEGMDRPNISNQFEAAGDEEADVVYDESGEAVWERNPI